MATDHAATQTASPPQRDLSDIPLEVSGIALDRLETIASIEDRPPDGGYGWVCTLSVFLVNFNTWGVNSSWAIILAYYLTHKTYQGATHLEYALIGGLSISQALLISPVITASHRYLGMRATLCIGSILVFLSLFTSSYTTQIWQLFLSQGVCFGWGMGFLYLTASAVLPPWFSSKRSLAVGISTSGSGIGGLCYSLLTGALIQKLGVEWTYRVLALCALVTNIISALLLREYRGRTQTARPKFSLRLRDLGKIEILLVVFWGVVTELGYITLLYSLPSYASSVGLTPSQGSVANALLALGQGVGRPFLGHFSDKFGRINMAMLATTLCGVLCFALWIPAHGFTMLAIFALLAGGICGTFWATITPILVEVVGISHLTRTFGIICFSMVLPTTFAEPVAMQIVESHGGGIKSFLGAQIFTGFTFIAGAISLLLLRSWKIANRARPEPEVPNESLSTGGQIVSRSRGWTWLAPKSLFSLKKV